jgi:Beta-fructosidases (levanase/invertase)
VKKNLTIYVIVILAFIVGCSKDQSTSPEEKQAQNGNVLLKIDKANAPSGVVSVTAYLFRTGYDTLKGNMNLITDSTASISFSNILPGTWRLRIDAKDNVGVVLYSGSADVDVKDALISQVNITLSPVNQSSGGVNILVSWGKAYSAWSDYTGNPILSKTNCFYNAKGVVDARVIYDDNTYKMWYTGFASDGKTYIMYASSLDGYNWSYRDTIPSLSPGASSWEAYEVDPGAVIKDQNGYKMYYSGESNNGVWAIGLATSPDGRNWTKVDGPILTGTSGWEYSISVSDVIKIGSAYYLYYNAVTSSYYYAASIGLAVSTDGIHFTKYAGNPVLTKSQGWEGNGVDCGTVIYDEGVYKMVYQNIFGSVTGFGMATSVDGVNWTKDNANPFFTNQNTYNNWSCSETSYPFFRKFNSEYRVYYAGLVNGSRCLAVVKK